MTTQQPERSPIPNSDRCLLHIDAESDGVRRCPRAEDPDAALVEGLKLQVPEAYDLLLRAYEKRLLRVAFKITMCTEDAEDAVQNTFLQVFKCVDKFRGECKFGSWITAIAINQALMTLRRNKREMVSLDAGIESGEQHVFHEIAGRECTPEQTCLGRELEESLIGFVTKLRKTNRSVFEMHIAEELALEEIAQRLGITVAATKSRLFRARRDIRSRAKKHAQSRQFRTIRRPGPSGTKTHQVRQKFSGYADIEMPMGWRSIAS